MAQYQSQFVPTDFNTLGNVLGMYRQDLKQADQEFDAAAMAESQTMAEIGALPSYDEQGKAQRLESISKAMEEAVAKRGGDYRLAAKDLQRIVARERANPWYQWNAQNQKDMEDYRKLAMNADNLIIKTPARTYAEAQQMQAEGKDPSALSALSKTALYRQVSDIASNLKTRMQSDPKFKSTLGGQYFQMMLDSKVTPENFEAFINTGEGAEIMRSVIASNPQLEGTNLDTVKEVIKQGLYSAIGKSDSQLVANQNHINPYNRWRMSAEQSQGATPSQYPDMNIEGKTKDVENLFSNARRALSGGNFDNKKLNTEVGSMPYSDESLNPFYVGALKRGEKGGSKTIKDTLVSKYKNIYDAVKKRGGTDEEFLNEAEAVAKNDIVKLNTELGFDKYDIGKDVFGKLQEVISNGKPNTFINVKTGDAISVMELQNRLKGTNTNMRMTPSGELVVEIPDEDGKVRELYKINEKAIPDNSKPTISNGRELLKLMNSYNLTDKDFEENTLIPQKGKTKGYQLSDDKYPNGVPKEAFRIVLDKNNPTNKKIIQMIFDQNGDVIGERELRREDMGIIPLKMHDNLRKSLTLEFKQDKQEEYEY